MVIKDNKMKNILARGGVEFLAVLLGITISLYIDQQIEDLNDLSLPEEERKKK